MSKVTFYTHVTNRQEFTCRLVEKAFEEQAQLLIVFDHLTELNTVNELLWTFHANSFLAHDVYLENQAFPQHSPIVLLLSHQLNQHELLVNRVLLNLSTSTYHQYQPQRVLEIIGADDEQLATARLRFRMYQDAHYVLEHHKMS